MSIKDWLIKKLGGYTEREMTHEHLKSMDKCRACQHNPYLNPDKELSHEERVKINKRIGEVLAERHRARTQKAFNTNSRKFALVKDAPAGTKLPTRKTKGSAGYDFYLPCDVHLEPYGDSPIILTGVKAYMPEDEVLLLFIRSSVGILKNVTLSNSVGVIDCDFCDNPENEGNIGLRLHNNSALSVDFKKGERIMQGVFVKFGTVVNDVTTGERKGGTGSTGKE